jgi:hypothetical protein
MISTAANPSGPAVPTPVLASEPPEDVELC